MKYKDNEEKDLYAVAAAILRSNGCQQQEIAENLGVLQPEVSRLLGHAEDVKWLEYPKPLLRKDRMGDLYQRAQAKFFSLEEILRPLKALQPKGLSVLKRVTLVHTNNDTENSFRSSVVDVIKDRLKEVSIVGVTWGRTINRLVETLKDHIKDLPRRERKPIQFVPLCGEPFQDRQNPLSFSSSHLAAELSKIFNGLDNAPPPSLAGVPAFIPHDFEDWEVDPIMRILRKIAGYEDVFGKGKKPSQVESALANRVEMILTSVGVPNVEPVGKFLEERVQLNDLTREQLKELIVGDLGGIILARQDRDVIDKLNARWTGINLDQIKRCAQSASRREKPGVIVFALGKARCEMARKCVELGLVNELIINQELGDELKRTNASVALASKDCRK